MLQRVQQLRAHEDQPLDQRVAGVGELGGLERAVEVVEDLDELEHAASRGGGRTRARPRAVTRSRKPSFSVRDLAVGGEHLRRADPRRAGRGARGARLRRRSEAARPRQPADGVGQTRTSSARRRSSGGSAGSWLKAPPCPDCADYSLDRARAGRPASRTTTSTTFVPVGPGDDQLAERPEVVAAVARGQEDGCRREAGRCSPPRRAVVDDPAGGVARAVDTVGGQAGHHARAPGSRRAPRPRPPPAPGCARPGRRRGR